MKLNSAVAARLIRSIFGAQFDFFVTGSVAFGVDHDGSDIDFVVNQLDYDFSLKDRFIWTPCSYYNGFKTGVDGVVFNAIVLSSDQYLIWKKATRVAAALTAYIDLKDKSKRVAIFETLLGVL